MLAHLDAWDRSAERRLADRRRSATGEGEPERRRMERRLQVTDTLERRRDSDTELLPAAPGGVVDAVSPLAPALPGPAAPPSPPQSSAAQRAAAGREAPLVIVTRTS